MHNNSFWTARHAGDDNQLGAAHYTLIEPTNTLGVDINDTASADDIIVREIHLPVDKQVLMKFRSQDVIHSAYLPHFGVQMNCVPGMVTQICFYSIKTTKEMRGRDGDLTNLIMYYYVIKFVEQLITICK